MIDLKTPPHSVDAEQALIAAVLAQPEVLLDIDMPAAAFYRAEHKTLWSAIRAMSDERKQIDLISVADRLDSEGKLESVGLEYLEQILGSAGSARNAQTYAEIVRGKALERNMISLALQLAESGYGTGSTQDKLNAAQALISGFSDGLQVVGTDEPHALDDCLRETIATLDAHWNSGGEMLGLPTGFADLDRRTNGLRRGDMIILAGRPSQGKTTLAMNIAENVAMAGKFVIVFSLEMPRQSLTTRMIASVGKVDHGRLQSGKMDDDEFGKVSSAGARLKGRALYIDDNSRLTSGQLLSRARRIAHKMGRKPDLIVVDYLQLLCDKGESVDRVTTISRNMKGLAREMDCPAIVLSQLNRGVEQRPDKRPLMSDLRDSGSIEQDADLIFMMYRDEYYNENSEHKGLAELICRKYRNGQIGTDILCSAHLNQCRFDTSTVKSIMQSLPMKKAGGMRYGE